MLRTTNVSAQCQSKEDSMRELYYIGLDIHKKSVSYCTKTKDGAIIAEGKVEATRTALSAWAGAA